MRQDPAPYLSFTLFWSIAGGLSNVFTFPLLRFILIIYTTSRARADRPQHADARVHQDGEHCPDGD
jgi:hypothetical protein